MESLSIAQARKLALLSQGLPARTSNVQPYKKTVEALEQLGYVQIDTISVVQRAHHHTLWNRNPDYQTAHLDRLMEDKQAFEYWSHAAAYLPMRDFRFSLPRKEAIRTNEQAHWYKKDHALMAEVLKRIELEGPLMAKDFESKSAKIGGWGSKPTKRALETLYMQGDLMIPKRVNFHKVYDLTERVLPENVDTRLPTNQEYAKFLVLRFIEAHGFGSSTEMAYLLKGMKPQVTLAIRELVEDKYIQQIRVGGEVFFTGLAALALLQGRLNKKQLKLLSPFDNLLIQRKRASSVFGFDYLLECYVPENKRQFGYFCLPVLWDGKIVARADCKVDKQTKTLNVIHLFLESSLKKSDEFYAALEKELGQFALFNHCTQHRILNITAR
ncbi:winged helix-turn-helix domain-containing protein [Vibrio amylolyticus]|uniref:winged helix-turn-helix domain-containing protein n=1 Tax=Vibrio amylolyticus TaxID=2847292 RepID=UPI00354CBC25